VMLAAVFQSQSIPEQERLDPETVAARLRAAGTPAEMRADAWEIVAALAPRLEAGDVVAIMSNGGFGGIYHLLPEAIAALAVV
jgi:UDP-N-acetylmuramate: L-alanyl-gamma-D-glutamyl-meso-diaminopimelate ligase